MQQEFASKKCFIMSEIGQCVPVVLLFRFYTDCRRTMREKMSATLECHVILKKSLPFERFSCSRVRFKVIKNGIMACWNALLQEGGEHTVVNGIPDLHSNHKRKYFRDFRFGYHFEHVAIKEWNVIFNVHTKC